MEKEKEKSPFSTTDIINTGPPPDLLRRQLIYDSLYKIIDNKIYNRNLSRSNEKDDRGTFIYTCGAGYHGQLGRKTNRGQKKYATLPIIVELIKPIRQVSCGGLHTAILTDNGHIYTWGDGRMGQLGNLDEGYNSHLVPHKIESLAARVVVKQIACGQYHTVCVTDQGKMYSWGWGKYGQTGLGERSNHRFPEEIMVEPKSGVDLFFSQVVCGDRHTIALTQAGAIFSFGCGEHGQLGLGNQADLARPALMEELWNQGIRIESIASGSVHSAALTDTGALYVWGFGEFFYRSGGKNFYFSPELVDFKNRIVSVACGQGHMLLLTDRGEVYTMGSGEYGQLGNGDTTNNRIPKLVLALDSTPISQIAAGRYHSIAIASNGAMFSWGCGENGQLGHGSDENELIPRCVEGMLGTVVGQVSCGEHHTACLTSCPNAKVSDDVLVWLAIQRDEYFLKKALVADTHKALSRRDLIVVRNTAIERAKNDDISDPASMVQSMLALIAADDKDKNSSFTASAAIDIATLNVNKKKPVIPKQFAIAVPPVAENKSSSPTLDTTRSIAAADMATPSDALTARATYHRETAAPLKGLISSLQDAVLQNSSPAQESQQTFAVLCQLRKEYDRVKALSVTKQSECKAVLRDFDSFQEAVHMSQNGDKDSEKRVSDLKMQLETVNIKIAETEDNRRNYELNIAHLKEEELENLLKLDALRRACTENNNLHRKMGVMRTRSIADRQTAEIEKQKFEAEINEYKIFLDEQRKVFSQITDNVLHTADSTYEVREEADVTQKLKSAARSDKLKDSLMEKEVESASVESKLEELNKSLSFYNKSFQQIVSATGLTDANEIVTKFFLKEEIKNELNTEVELKTKKLEDLKNKLSILSLDIQARRDISFDSRWRDVDEIEEKVRESLAAADKLKQESDRNTQQIAAFREGISTLTSRISKVLGVTDDFIPKDLTAPSCSLLLSNFESKFDDIKNGKGKNPFLIDIGPKSPSFESKIAKTPLGGKREVKRRSFVSGVPLLPTKEI